MSQLPCGRDIEALEPNAEEASLPYELLLRKTADAPASCEEASTVEPTGSCSESSLGSATPVAPLLRKTDLCFANNVAINGPKVDKALVPFIAETRKLSKFAFDEDCLQDVNKKTGWQLSLLVSHEEHLLCGFAVAKVAKGSLQIAKIAVPPCFRGRGFGKLMMDELMRAAKKQGDVYDVCLSSLAGAVSFYQRLGFKAFRDLKVKPEEGVEYTEGQVYMERRLKKRPSARR